MSQNVLSEFSSVLFGRFVQTLTLLQCIGLEQIFELFIVVVINDDDDDDVSAAEVGDADGASN